MNLNLIVTILDTLVALAPEKQWLVQGEPTTEDEFLSMVFCVTGADATGSAILSNSPSDVGLSWATVKSKYDELVSGKPMELLREERNRRLAETDWWASSDLTMTAEQTAYRQALRDITATYSSLDDVEWPTKP